MLSGPQQRSVVAQVGARLLKQGMSSRAYLKQTVQVPQIWQAKNKGDSPCAVFWEINCG